MKKLFRSIALGLAAAFALTSCDSGVFATMTSQQEIDALYAEAASAFKEANVIQVEIKAKEVLEDPLGSLEVLYKDSEDGKYYTQDLYPGPRWADPDAVMLGDLKYKDKVTRPFADFKPFQDIKKLTEEAIALSDEISDNEYEDFKLYSLKAETTPKGVDRFLTLTATKKGEEVKYENRRRVVTYYEFKWKLLDDGTLEFVE